VPPKKLLILGGTTEAAELASAAFEAGVDVITSLAGRLAPRRTIPGHIRIGGFGGVPGLVRYLEQEGIDVVIDATHPFAATMSAHACAACSQAGIPRLALVRPPWQAAPDDRWREVVSLGEAAALLPGIARRAFLTTGPGGIEAFSAVPNVSFLVRVFAAPAAPLPLPRHDVIVGRPPFTLDSELALFRRHRIDTLVTKQSGGPTDAKLAAAREAGAEVIMVRRPPPPAGMVASSVAEALGWLRQAGKTHHIANGQTKVS
jgi:precorrin-6A/cobalt-precorrin-6A reductase